LHLISSRHPVDASGITVQNGCQPSLASSFASDLNSVISSFEKLGNPSVEDSNDLYVLATMHDEVIAIV